MSDRLLKYLFIALGALVVAYVGARLLAGRDDASGEATLDLAAAAEAGLDSVVIRWAADTLRLRGGDGWTVNGHEAIADAGDALSRALEQANVGPLASRNPENHDRLGVADGMGRRVDVYSGGEARLSIIVGKQARGIGQAYVRGVGDDEVYTLDGSLVSLARRGLDEWREKQIVSLSRGDVRRIELTYPEESFALVGDTAGWTIEPSGQEADGNAVSSLLGQLAGLRALGFAADSVADTLTWSDPTARVRVTGPGGNRLAEIEFLDREDTGYYVRRAGGDVVFTLSRFAGDQVLKRSEELVVSEQ